MEKKLLVILAPQDFRDEEFFKARAYLKAAGVNLVSCSKPKVEEAVGSLGGRVVIDLGPEEVDLDEFDGLVFIGGPGALAYLEDQDMLDLARRACEKEKIIAAICIAPSILANAGVLLGKKATAFPSQAENLKAKGATFTGAKVTIDGRIITASGPEEAADFGKELVKLLT